MTATPDGQGPSREYVGYSDWKGWNRFFTFTDEDASYFRREFGAISLAGASVFEMGFGEGRFLAWAKSCGASVTGSELEKEALAAALEAGIATIQGSIADHAQALPGTLDYFVAFDVFEHLDFDAIDAALASAALLLKPNGKIVLRYPNGQSPFGLGPQHADVTHVTALSQRKLDQLAGAYGLETLRYAGAADPIGSFLVNCVRWFRRTMRALLGRILNFIYATNIVWDPVVTHVLVKRAD